MKAKFFEVLGKLPKAYCIYFCVLALIFATFLLVYNFKVGKTAENKEEYTKTNLVCIAVIIISIIGLAAIWRWWL